MQVRVPDPSGTSVNRQCAAGTSGSPTAQPKTRSGSNSQIVDTVSQVPRASWWLRPRKRAPSAGPVAPSSHWPPWNSVLNSAGVWMSQTRAQTADGGASISSSASVVGQSA